MLYFTNPFARPIWFMRFGAKWHGPPHRGIVRERSSLPATVASLGYVGCLFAHDDAFKFRWLPTSKLQVSICNTDHYHFFNHAASQVSAKDCVEEARAARKRDPCRTLAMIAAAKLDGADDPLFKILRGCGLVLDVPTTKLQLDPSFEYPCFSPRDMLLAIAKRGFLHKVLGVPLSKAHQAIPEFWRKHRKLFPNHELHSQPDVDYEHLIPYYLHGDGGRTFKKDGILICSMFPALGKGTRTKPIDLQPVPGEPPRGVKRKRTDSHGSDGQFSAGINLLGNSLTTRFLFTALKYEFYKEHHHRFSELVNQWALFMKSLFEEGFDF